MRSFQLNDRQLEAVSHKNGPMMVLSGPGSGKTTVIAHRVKNLIETHMVPPSHILVITFTKAAAAEMQERFNRLTENRYGGSVLFGTFHSFFFRIIRNRYRYKLENVLKDYEKKEILKEIIRRKGIESPDEDEFLQELQNEISLMKNELFNPEHYQSSLCGADEFRSVYQEYESFKAENHKIDFDDMLSKCYELINENTEVLELWQSRYEYILIDEFQDINKVQYESIKLLSAPAYNLFIVGDDDQSIYQFRGARPEFLLRFPEDMRDVKAVTLNVNYRSTDNIIRVCNKIISDNTKRYEKDIVGRARKGGDPIFLKYEDADREAVAIAKKIKAFPERIPREEIAVIYRTNIQARAFVDVFMDMKIPFQLKDEMKSIYEHFTSTDICSYMRLALDRDNRAAAARIINRPKRYINKSYINRAEAKTGSLIKNLLQDRQLQIWQRTRVEELNFYLTAIASRKPYDAFKYIRQAVLYDDYIKDYAEYRKMMPTSLFDLLDELQEGARAYTTLEEYLLHVEEVIAEIRGKQRSRENQEGVVLTTMHSAKGLEFEAVFLPSVIEGVIPHEKSKTDSEIEEERRLLYVAMTRAKDQLYISTIGQRHDKDVQVTRFLKNTH